MTSKIKIEAVKSFLMGQITALEQLLAGRQQRLELTIGTDIHSLSTVKAHFDRNIRIEHDKKGLQIQFCHASYPAIFMMIFDSLRTAPELLENAEQDEMASLHSKLYRAHGNIHIDSALKDRLLINNTGLEILFNRPNKPLAQSSNSSSYWSPSGSAAASDPEKKSLLDSQDGDDSDEDDMSYRSEPV